LRKIHDIFSEDALNYPVIEQETLAVVWACKKFRDYIVGLRVVIKTDHKPLIPLLNNIELGKNPARIQRFRIRLMRFQYKAEHISGKKMLLQMPFLVLYVPTVRLMLCLLKK